MLGKSVFFASGKLLLFGEYLVLRDSLSLAIPLKYGQYLKVEQKKEEGISWESKVKGEIWLNLYLSNDLELISSSDKEKGEIIEKLFLQIQKENPNLPLKNLSFEFTIDFEREFGWGTSSTLISLLSQWANVNPYKLLESSFGGSGYDVAAGTAKSPFLYTLGEKNTKNISLPDEVTEHLLFIYLGKKQNSAKEVAKFNDLLVLEKQVEKMNEIVLSASQCVTIEEWEEAMLQSENLLASILKQEKVKDKFFKDYPYEIKSLGAWGGDFIMATCRDKEKAENYFTERGFFPVFTYKELIKE